MTRILSAIYFTADTCTRFVEEDRPDKGCIPETAFSTAYNCGLRAPTLRELLQQIVDHADATPGDVDLDSCDEPGRVDVCTLETADAVVATPRQVEEWKAGRLRLFCVVSTFYVVRRVEESVPLRLDSALSQIYP